MARRWTQRPDGSTWGDWGDDDELGALNLIDDAAVRRGVAAVSDGLRFGLSLPLDLPGGQALNPRRKPPVISPTVGAQGPRYNQRQSVELPGVVDVVTDDHVSMHTQYSTQWDALAHFGAVFDPDGEGEAVVYYNGFRADRDVILAPDGDGWSSRAERGSIASLARHPVQTRGVLVDLLHHLGPERRSVDYETLRGILDADGIEIAAGDVLLVRSGFAGELLRMNGQPDPERLRALGADLDGSDPALRDWVAASGLAAIAADTYAVESFDESRVDPATGSRLPLHQLCIFKLGMPLGELWYLDELADALRERGRSNFLLTAPSLYLRGAVGSPVTPVATI
jgi:Predicted metal-dependent hydrolase